MEIVISSIFYPIIGTQHKYTFVDYRLYNGKYTDFYCHWILDENEIDVEVIEQGFIIWDGKYSEFKKKTIEIFSDAYIRIKGITQNNIKIPDNFYMPFLICIKLGSL